MFCKIYGDLEEELRQQEQEHFEERQQSGFKEEPQQKAQKVQGREKYGCQNGRRRYMRKIYPINAYKGKREKDTHFMILYTGAQYMLEYISE